MLDEQLPSKSLPLYTPLDHSVDCLSAFLLRPSTERPKQLSTYLFAQYGNDPQPAYSLRHPDPLHNDSRNRYAAALYDAFNPEILYAEVLLIPAWVSPQATAEQLRLNGGVPPPPEPVLPTEFTIQLYNPDQQITIRQKKPGTFSPGSPSWEFEMPQQTFREPSLSTLDRTQHDPGAMDYTPKIGFKWKKDSKLSKDLICFLSGKGANPDGKKKHKEPDITVAIFKALKEITMYEPNLQRVELEDMKGFEVVLLLGAVVIRDVYFGNMKETFNITDGRRLSQPGSPPGLVRPTSAGAGYVAAGRDSRVPPTDPRTQWEIEAQSALLKRQAAQEERESQRRREIEERQSEAVLRRERDEQQRRQAQIDQETERLKRMYGQEDNSARPNLPPRHSDPQRHSYQAPPWQPPPQQGYQYGQGFPHVQHPATGNTFANSPWMSSTQGGPDPYLLDPTLSQQPQRVKPKHSFFGLRRDLDVDDGRLQKKRSAIF